MIPGENDHHTVKLEELSHFVISSGEIETNCVANARNGKCMKSFSFEFVNIMKISFRKCGHHSSFKLFS